MSVREKERERENKWGVYVHFLFSIYTAATPSSMKGLNMPYKSASEREKNLRKQIHFIDWQRAPFTLEGIFFYKMTLLVTNLFMVIPKLIFIFFKKKKSVKKSFFSLLPLNIVPYKK